MWHDGIGYAGWWGFGLGMILFWGLVIVGIVLLVRWAVGSRGAQQPPAVPPAQPGPPAVPSASDAHRILDERFARGEIDEDDYRRRRDLLRGG